MRSLVLVLSLCAELAAQLGPYGHPCTTATMLPTLDFWGPARLGTTFVLDATWMHAAPIVTFVLGTSRTTWSSLNLPYHLAAIGRPDCALLASGELIIDWPSSIWPGIARLPIAVPNDPRFVGVTLFAQAFDWAPAQGLAMTNGYALRIVP